MNYTRNSTTIAEIDEILMYPRFNTIHDSKITISEIIDNYWDLRSVSNWLNIIEPSNIQFTKLLMIDLHLVTHIHKGLLTQYDSAVQWNTDKRLRHKELQQFRTSLECGHRMSNGSKSYRLINDDGDMARCDICENVFSSKIPTFEQAKEYVEKFHFIFEQLMEHLDYELSSNGYSELPYLLEFINSRMDALIDRYKKCFER